MKDMKEIMTRNKRVQKWNDIDLGTSNSCNTSGKSNKNTNT